MNTTKQLVLDIAMNLNRIGNWAADGYDQRKARIITFLENNAGYIEGLKGENLSEPFKKTYDNFVLEYKTLEKEGLIGPKDADIWAEKMMTWGNILTHRASLIQEENVQSSK